MFKLLIALSLLASICSAADLVSLQASSSSQQFNGSLSSSPLFLPFAAHGDTILTQGVNPDDSTTYWLVFREKNGQFVNVATVSTESSTQFPLNNGKWMGGLFGGDTVFELFRLDANDNPVNHTVIALPTEVSHAALLSDNTIVYMSYGSPNSTVSSLIFNENNSTWSAGASFDVMNVLPTSFPFTSVWIDDNHFIFINGSSRTFIYSRQQDGSWLPTDSFLFNMTIAQSTLMNLYHNGDDTIVFAFPVTSVQGQSDGSGFVVIYTKVNNEWHAKVITADDIGLNDVTSYLGFRTFTKIDENNLLLGAPFGYSPSTKRGIVVPVEPAVTKSGAAFLLQRQGDEWAFVASITSSDNGILGSAVGVSGNNLVVTMARWTLDYCTFQLYTVPLCIAQPLNITCSDQQVSKCQIDSDSLSAYTVEQCAGLEVSTAIKSATFNDYSLQVSLEFDRPLSPSYSCNVTLTCARPPTTVTVPTGKSVSGASVVSLFGASVLLVLFSLL